MGSTAFAERAWLLLLESTHVSAGARIALYCLIALLLVALGFLVACAWMIRKRAPAAQAPKKRGRRGARLAEELKEAVLAHRRGSGREKLPEVVEAAVACPTCRREYEEGLEFCPRDARRLVPRAELGRAKSGGGVCPRCQRAFDPGVRFCPNDAAELLPISIYEATHGRDDGTAPTGIIAKICPQCRSRHDLSATFCGKDGSELAVLN